MGNYSEKIIGTSDDHLIAWRRLQTQLQEVTRESHSIYPSAGRRLGKQSLQHRHPNLITACQSNFPSFHHSGKSAEPPQTDRAGTSQSSCLRLHIQGSQVVQQRHSGSSARSCPSYTRVSPQGVSLQMASYLPQRKRVLRVYGSKATAMIRPKCQVQHISSS
jgi:hypothetical protein